MLRIIMALFLTLTASFGAIAGTGVDISAFEKSNALVDCIIAHGGMRLKAAKVCFQSGSEKSESMKTVLGGKEWTYRNVGGDSFKKALLNAVRKASTKAEKEMVVGRMTHAAVYSLGLTPENTHTLFPVMHSHFRVLTKLSTDDSLWENFPKQFNTHARGEKFESMVLGDGSKTKSNVRVAIHPYKSHLTGQITDVLPSSDLLMPDGTVVPFLWECWNLSSQSGHHQAKPVDRKVVIQPEAPEEVIPETKNVEEENVLDDWELYVSMGGSLGGHGSAVGYGAVSGAYFPGALIKDMENGRLEGGLGMQANGWIGQTHDSFHYNGYVAVGGPAIKYIDWDGWDFELRLNAGILQENGHKTDYDSKRSGGVVGPSMSYNNYERQLAGHDWFPEYGFYGSVLTPFSFNAHHSWQGNSIADTNDLRKMNYLLNVSGRLFVYKNDDWGIRFFTQAGYFQESPTGQSVSLRVGVGDTQKRWGVSVGPNFDLLHNWNVEFGADAWADISVIVDTQRNESNMAEMRAAFAKDGIVYHEETGALTIPGE